MSIAYEMRPFSATCIFFLTDVYVRNRGTRGKYPFPIGAVKFFLKGRFEGGVRRDLETPLEMIVKRNDSGYYLFFGKTKLPDLRVCRAFLPEGRYVVRVESRFYQPFENDNVFLPTPGSPYSFDLEPGYAYPFPSCSSTPKSHGPTLLRGGTYRTDGVGREGVIVRAPGRSNACLTDKTGRWVLIFPDEDPGGKAVIRFEFPEGVFEDIGNVDIKKGHGSSLPGTALRGRVLNDADVGLRGVTVRVDGHPGRTTTNTNGDWLYYFGLNQPADTVDVAAERTDGRTVNVSDVQVIPRETVEVPTHRFT